MHMAASKCFKGCFLQRHPSTQMKLQKILNSLSSGLRGKWAKPVGRDGWIFTLLLASGRDGWGPGLRRCQAGLLSSFSRTQRNLKALKAARE